MCGVPTAGYESENDSSESGNHHGREEDEEEEEEREVGESGEDGGKGGEDLLGSQTTQEEDGQKLTIVVNESSGEGEEVRNQSSDEPSTEVKRSPPEGSSEKGHRTFLERLKLTRRSNSPERGGREEGEGGGGIMMSVRKGLLGLNGERLAAVGRRGGEASDSGEFGEGGGEGEEPGVGERGGEEKERPTEGGKDGDYCFTLALVSRRSRHRAGELYSKHCIIRSSFLLQVSVVCDREYEWC